MPLVNAQGHRISKEDEKIIEEMLSGSIDSHLARLKEVRDRNRDREAVLSRSPIGRWYFRVHKANKNRLYLDEFE